jgi:hypothetical protein
MPLRYEGGTLPLGLGKIKVTVSEDKLVFTQGARKLSIPLQKLEGIARNTDVRRRFGASVLSAVPRVHLDTVEEYYVGLTWTDSGPEGQFGTRLEGVFKLSGSDYYNFLATLERLTGKKAVDTHRAPAVVRYGI